MQSSCPNHAPLPTRKLHAMIRGGNGRHGHDCDARREQNSIERRCRPLAGASCGSLLRADDMRFEIVEAVPVGCGWAVVGRPRDAQLHAVPDPSSASLRRRSMEWPPSPERLSYLLPRLNLPYEIEISLQNLAGTCAVYKPHRSDTRTHLRDSLARVRICLAVKPVLLPNVHTRDHARGVPESARAIYSPATSLVQAMAHVPWRPPLAFITCGQRAIR